MDKDLELFLPLLKVSIKCINKSLKNTNLQRLIFSISYTNKKDSKNTESWYCLQTDFNQSYRKQLEDRFRQIPKNISKTGIVEIIKGFELINYPTLKTNWSMSSNPNWYFTVIFKFINCSLIDLENLLDYINTH